MRRRRPKKLPILPDAKYSDKKLAMFINKVMLDGKKSVSEKIVYGAFDEIAKQTKEEPLAYFHQALENIMPTVEVRSRRVGGATYQVPVEVRATRATALAMKWIIGFARKRGEKTMTERMAKELMDAFNKRGGAFKKREDTHKMAEANRAFAHYKF